MLNQVVYTRCKPCRDLLHNGEVQNKDGYGVFSMSSELLAQTSPADRQALEQRLRGNNGSNESAQPGLICSYEFVMLPGGQNALIRCSMRPKAETEGHSRANGSSMRPNAFVAQALVGEFTKSPAEWFGSCQWDAAGIPAEAYYLDAGANPEPPYLPQVSDTPSDGSISEEKLRAFIQGGRADTVVTCLQYLIQEYEKPEQERRPILIKDTPENVELWIAAIESGLSAKLAAMIPFATNRTKLSSNAEAALFALPGAGSAPAGAARGARPGEKTRPLYMIAGYHPRDPFCASVRQTQASRFVLLDGTTGQLGITPDEKPMRKYYQAIVQCSDDIRDFREIVLPYIPLKSISGVIPDLYDAYKYLFDREHRPDSWDYQAAFRHLECLSRFGICENRALVENILDRFSSVYGRQFLQEDGRAGYPLLTLLGKYAEKIGRESEITEILADSLRGMLQDLSGRGRNLTESWENLSHAEGSLVQPVLEAVFSGEMPSLCAGQFAGCASSVVLTVTQMYSRKLAGNAGREVFPADATEFMGAAAERLADDSAALKKFTGGYLSWPESLCAALFAAAQRTGNPTRRELLLDTLFECTKDSPRQICRDAIRSGMDPAWIEDSLARIISRRRECSEVLEDAFYELLNMSGTYEGMGTVFYGAWLSFCEDRELLDLVESVREAKLSPESEKQIFKSVDSRISPDILLEKSGKLEKAVTDWAQSLRIRSKTGILRELLDGLSHASAREEEALEVLERFTSRPIPESADFFTGRYFEELSLCAGECGSPAVHQAVLSVFQTSDKNVLRRCASRYVECVLKNAGGKRLAQAVAGLGEASVLEYDVHGVEKDRISAARRAIKAALEEQLSRFYKRGLPEEVDKMDDVEETARDYLESLFEQESAKGGFGGVKDMFRKGGSEGGLMDRFRKSEPEEKPKKGGSEGGLKDIIKGFGGLFGKK